jgi:hypothetical protein
LGSSAIAQYLQHEGPANRVAGLQDWTERYHKAKMIVCQVFISISEVEGLTVRFLHVIDTLKIILGGVRSLVVIDLGIVRQKGLVKEFLIISLIIIIVV